MLNVLILEPPVPHISNKVFLNVGWIVIENCLIISIIARISSTVSPLKEIFLRIEEASESCIFPSTIFSKINLASLYEKLFPEEILVNIFLTLISLFFIFLQMK